MEKKIIFLDIDGTLTEPGSNEPPKSAVWAIRQAQKKGNYVFLCTGRNYNMLQPLLQYHFDGVIASSGGYITCDETVIFDCPMTEQQRQLAMGVLKENGVYRTVECLDGSYTDAEFKEFCESTLRRGATVSCCDGVNRLKRHLIFFQWRRIADSRYIKL